MITSFLAKPGRGASHGRHAITPDGKTAYLTRDRCRNGFDIPGNVVPINTATNTAGPGILVGLRPSIIAITP